METLLIVMGGATLFGLAFLLWLQTKGGKRWLASL